MRTRPRQARQLVGVGLAFALVFAPGEALAATDEAQPTAASTRAVAVAVLAPTFVSTPLLRPEPAHVVTDASIAEGAADSLPLTAVPGMVPAVVALVAFLTRRPLARFFPAFRAPRRKWHSGAQLRAPPLFVASTSA